RPQELPEDVFVVTYGFPGPHVMSILASINNALWITLMIALVEAFGIIISRDIQCTRILRFFRHSYACSSGRYRAVVEFAHDCCEAFSNGAETHGIWSIFFVASKHSLGKSTFGTTV